MKNSNNDKKITFFRESDLKTKQVLEGITLRAVFGDKTMMTFFEFEPYAVIPSHKHHHVKELGSN